MTVGELRKKLEGVPDDYLVFVEPEFDPNVIDAKESEQDDASKTLTFF